jgi:hypothetical protein
MYIAVYLESTRGHEEVPKYQEFKCSKYLYRSPNQATGARIMLSSNPRCIRSSQIETSFTNIRSLHTPSAQAGMAPVLLGDVQVVYSVCLRTGQRLPYSSAKLVAIGRGYFQESVQVSIFFRRGSMYVDVYEGHKIPRSTRYFEYSLKSTRRAFTRIYPREINRNIVRSPHNESEYPILRCHG